MSSLKIFKKRRLKFFLSVILIVFYLLVQIVFSHFHSPSITVPQLSKQSQASLLAINALQELKIKGRAPKTGYSRQLFGNGWSSIQGCTTRNIILHRDLEQVVLDDKCNVLSGRLEDPYSGQVLNFKRNDKDSDRIDIDHVVALADAWQKGAQQLDQATRVKLANDPLELLAVSSSLNIQKGASDAASWLPPNKGFRCQYVARQIAVKRKYSLWVTRSELEAMRRILEKCPNQALPG